MALNGGARPGAGRKPKSDKYSGQIAAAEDRIADRLPELIDNLFVLASGVTISEPMPNGGNKVYTQIPDRQSIEYLVNRIMGKPAQSMIVGGDDERPPIRYSDPGVERIADKAASSLISWQAMILGQLAKMAEPPMQEDATPS